MGSTSALLAKESSSSSSSEPPKTKTKLVFISLILSNCVAVFAAAAFAFFLFVSPKNSNHISITNEVSRTLTKLKHPVVLLISSDGFRFGYQYKASLPSINRLIQTGTEAKLGLIPSFPTITFPNHYSIVTGLYPAYHGIINNYFTDPVTGDKFTTRNRDSKWWLGEPLWETVTKNGLKASSYFWPGCEIKKGTWDCPKEFCPKFNMSVPFEERVDTVLSYFDDLNSDNIPSFMNLYFEDPDSQGHIVGPDDQNVTKAVIGIDKMIGRLIQGLEKRGIFEEVNVILLGDHGMVGNCIGKSIILDDLAEWIQIPKEWVQSYSPLLAITPPSTYSPAEVKQVVRKINKGLKSLGNGAYLRVYLKEDLPTRLHYSDSIRIPPIIGMLAEGYKVEQSRPVEYPCGGAHGYDNKFFSMRSIFIAHGPNFAKGKKVPSFENIQIYNLVLKILNIKGAPNNGTDSFADGVLLPSS